MPQTINTNISSLNAQRNLNMSQTSLATSMQRLSSGLRLNSAKDDAAGLAISERMNTQVRGLNVAARNANDGISLAQTAEGALGKVGDMLQRMRELAVQSANATNNATDRAALQAEVQQLKDEIGRVAATTSFNGTRLLDGSFTTQNFQVGANSGETITLDAIADVDLAALGTLTTPSTSVTTITPATPGSPAVAAVAGSYTTGAITAFDFSGTPGGFSVDGNAVALTTDLTDQATLIAEIQTQLNAAAAGAYTVAASGSGISITSAVAGATPAVAITGATGEFAGGTAVAGADAVPAVAAVPESSTTTVTPGTTTVGIAGLTVATAADSASAMDAIDSALTVVNTARGTLGAVQSRFENAISSIQVTAENLTAARGRIVDADFAMETANLSRAQILQQAGTAMVAQANQLPQQVLQLLK